MAESAGARCKCILKKGEHVHMAEKARDDLPIITLPDPILSTAPSATRVREICFRIQQISFGIDIQHVSGLLEVPPITRVFHTPSFVCGIINLRGRILAVVDVGGFFGLDPVIPSPEARIVVVETENREFGIIVSRVLDIRNIQTEQIQPATGTLSTDGTDLLCGLISSERETILLLDPIRLIRSPAIRQLIREDSPG